ncbi:Alpha/Beta hydrolase protein [Coniella lustricola]|uniref:Alpha/Beta hydrolase protein n=1 Tax=Coniella lustricola TaxID=2025994 RepID=A0A2T3A3Z4_9PEZI|nr:Alpha/Beta hydrolase protein [Coniella lustricola]
MRSSSSSSSSMAASVSALLLLPLVQAALYDQVVDTAYGPVQGYAAFSSEPANMTLPHWADVTVWKGIPFGADTAFANRFKYAQPVEPWNATLEASAFGDSCLSSGTTYANISENCLNLNVWSPANSTRDRLPVVLWSYPAGGSNADPRFDGGGLAGKGVVFVNYNYRDGPTGFLVTPELSAERYAATGVNSSGNYAVLDQVAALKWVRANIGSFGGDPDRITAMGQSAGSAATYHMLNGQLTHGDLAGAIIQSGAYSAAWMASVGCSDVACLRALPAATLDVAAQPGTTAVTFKESLDLYAIPETYADALARATANQVPVLTGNTRDESGATFGLDMTLAAYLADLDSTYSGDYPARFLQAYGANDSAAAAAAYNAQFTDRSKVGTALWAAAFAAGEGQHVFTYLWDHAPPGSSSGAAHESEIQYTLANLYYKQYAWEAEDYAIAAVMSDYWVNFIKTGNPNGDGLHAWLSINENATVTQELGEAFGPIPIASPDQIALFTEWFASEPAL